MTVPSSRRVPVPALPSCARPKSRVTRRVAPPERSSLSPIPQPPAAATAARRRVLPTLVSRHGAPLGESADRPRLLRPHEVAALSEGQAGSQAAS